MNNPLDILGGGNMFLQKNKTKQKQKHTKNNNKQTNKTKQKTNMLLPN